jgi:hypothetical protein
LLHNCESGLVVGWFLIGSWHLGSSEEDYLLSCQHQVRQMGSYHELGRHTSSSPNPAVMIPYLWKITQEPCLSIQPPPPCICTPPFVLVELHCLPTVVRTKGNIIPVTPYFL